MPIVKWRYDFVWKAYALACEGSSDSQIAATLNCQKKSITNWKRKYKSFANAIAAGRKTKPKSSLISHTENLQQFVHGRLPEDLKPIWNEMLGADENNSVLPEKRLAALLGGREDSTRALQTLWLYTWFECNFNASEACRRVGISWSLLTHNWKHESNFLELFNEMNRIKGDYFESALVKGVKEGNPYLIAFANKTFNRDRGYGESLDVKISGTIHHNHVVLIEKLELPLEMRKQLLIAVRKQQVIQLETETQIINVN